MSVLALLVATQDFAASPHGRQAASSGLTDWALLALAVVAVAIAFLLCLRFFLRPGEHDPAHIKRVILRDTPRSSSGHRTSTDRPPTGRRSLFLVPREPR